MAADETKATKAPPASRAPSPSAKKNSVVAPTYAYKIVATFGHLCVTAFVLASFAGWYYLLNNRAKLTTFCLFIFAHYRYVRIRAHDSNFVRGARFSSLERLTGCFVTGAHATRELAAPIRGPQVPRTVNGTGHTGPSEFCATSI